MIVKAVFRVCVYSFNVLFFTLTSCTSVTIDEYRKGNSHLTENDAVVVLGRRHSSDYETEPELIECIAEILADGDRGINVIKEQEFLDNLYPWFEPRTAPMNMRRLERMIQEDQIGQKLQDYNISFIVWIDGNTETTESSGTIGCSISAAGGGCFGMGTWEKESNYEASIWDYKERKVLGKINADASGTSYMPAIVIPIPIIARVQANACKGIAKQLLDFFTPSTD